MSSLQIGRLLVGPPLVWSEPFGDPVQGEGGAVVSAPRVPYAYQPTISTLAADGQTDTLTARLRIRRQLRSLLNNTPLKLGAFLYLIYSDDLEQDGWYVPDQGTLQDYSAASGLATGLWQQASTWYLAGRMRTHREARQVWMKDLRTGLYARDVLGWVYSTDFAALPDLALNVLPAGASSASDSVTGGVVAGAPLPTGRDGGQATVVQGLTDMSVISYERPESSLNLSDVIVYDRRGQITAPSTGPDTSWEEAYGPDHAWNWITAGQPHDTPVLDNGLVRVRYDASVGNPGFRIDVWTGSAYVEQGKIIFDRSGDVGSLLDTWVSSSLYEWTPERGILQVTLASSVDAYSREQIYITVQRGEQGLTVEYYPAPKSTGLSADGFVYYTMNGPDSNDSVVWETTTTVPPATGNAHIWSTASSNWTSASGTFSSATSNLVSVLRCQGGATTVGPYQINLAVVQQNAGWLAATNSGAYGGTAQNTVEVYSSSGQGYLQVHLAFVATQSDQVKGAVSSWTSTQASQYRVFKLVSSTWSDCGEYTGSAVSTTSATRVEAYQTQDRTRTGAIYGGYRDQAQAALTDSRQLGALAAR